jgi:drug/metabolite transporter (DMT)-like permease
MIQLQAIDYLILAVYFLFVLGIGWMLRRQIQTGADFLTSGRKIPAWIAGLAFLSANLGAQEVIGMGACGAKYGMLTCHFYWLPAVAAMVFVGVFMMPWKGSLGAGLVLFAAAAFQQIGLQQTSSANSGFITTFYILFVPVLGIYWGHKVPKSLWAAIPVCLLGFYLLQVVCQKRCPPAPASIIMSLEAVFAALAGYLVLNQTLTGRAIIGCSLILSGVLMVQLVPMMGKMKDGILANNAQQQL